MDPVTLDICWNRLIGVVNEQAAALMRTSFTSIVREAGDLSAGVFDRRGFMIAQAVTGTPGHINSMAPGHEALPRRAARSRRLAPGDVLITNDPWKTSGHLNDVTICTPVFRGRTASPSSRRPATPPTSAATSSPRRRARLRGRALHPDHEALRGRPAQRSLAALIRGQHARARTS